jgi:hypothetical protein
MCWQQRLTTLFASLKGLKIARDDHEDDFSEFYLNLGANEDDLIVLTVMPDEDHYQAIKLRDLLYGKLKHLASYPEKLQDKIQDYKERITAYQFSGILIKEAPIDVATEIFTRLNVSGKPLSVFEIMVAKTFDSKKDFDLAEKYDELIDDLETVDYGTIPDSVVLILLCKECRKRDILGLPKTRIIDIWPDAVDAIKYTVELFRNTFRIPVSQLLPYPNLIVPFAYYFHTVNHKPTGRALKYLEDYFWRAAIGGRYSQSVESRLSQDILKIDAIIDGQLPKYEWAVDVSTDFIENNGWFSVGRAYIKALLCILAFHEPKSFNDGSVVRISNDWLKQANSKNYHHFFPRAFLQKKGESDHRINHIANIAIVDDFLNKREIGAKAPSKYMRKFAKQNQNFETCMRTHLIRPLDFGVYEDDYDKFFRKRCQGFSRELKKRIIEQDVDSKRPAVPASETQEVELE